MPMFREMLLLGFPLIIKRIPTTNGGTHKIYKTRRASKLKKNNYRLIKISDLLKLQGVPTNIVARESLKIEDLNSLNIRIILLL